LVQEDNDLSQADTGGLADGSHHPYETSLNVDYVVQLARASTASAASAKGKTSKKASSKGDSGSSKAGSSEATEHTAASSADNGSTHHSQSSSSKGGSASQDLTEHTALSSKGSGSSKGGTDSSLKGKSSKRSSSSKGKSSKKASDSQDTGHTKKSQSTVHTVPSQSTKHTGPSKDTTHTAPSQSSLKSKESSVKGSHSSAKGSTGYSTKKSSSAKGKGGSSYSSSSKGKGNGVTVPSLTTIPSLDDEDDLPNNDDDDTIIVIPNPDRVALDNCILNAIKKDGLIQEVYDCTAYQDYNFAQEWVTLNSTLTCPAEDVRNVGLVMASRDTNVGCECETQRTTWVFWVLGIEDQIQNIDCNCFACPPNTEIGRRGGYEYQCDSAITGQCLNFDCEGRCNGMTPTILPPIQGFLTPSPDPGTPIQTTPPPTLPPSPPPTQPARTVTSGIPSTHPLSYTLVALLVLKSIMR